MVLTLTPPCICGLDGSWVNLLAYNSGTADSGIVDDRRSWSNVTGMKLYGKSYNGDCASSSYSLLEMQAIIGKCRECKVDFKTPRTPFSGGSGAMPQGLVTEKQALWVGIITLSIRLKK
jgi:hypothetical protein